MRWSRIYLCHTVSKLTDGRIWKCKLFSCINKANELCSSVKANDVWCLCLHSSMLDEAQMNEDRAQKRAQQLESDLKSLKKDLYRKSTEMTSLRRSATIRTPPQHQSTAPQVGPVTASYVQHTISIIINNNNGVALPLWKSKFMQKIGRVISLLADGVGHICTQLNEVVLAVSGSLLFLWDWQWFPCVATVKLSLNFLFRVIYRKYYNSKTGYDLCLT